MDGTSSAKLDREAWLLIVLGILFAVATALSNTFVNVYLWKIKRDLLMISKYHLASYLGMLVATGIAGWLSKNHDRVFNVRLGVGVLSIFYLFVLFLGESAPYYVWFLGALLGMGCGFFWLATSIMYFEITTPDNRDHFNGVNGLWIALASMIAPMISGFITSNVDHHLTGYRWIFTLSLGIFVLAVVISFFFRSRPSQGGYSLFAVWREIWRHDYKWYWVSWMMFIQGLRDGVLLFLLGLLIYMTTDNEMVLGWFLTASSLIALFANFVLTKWLTLQRREFSIWVGTIMIGLVILPYFFWPNIWTLFVLGLGISFFYPLYFAPLTSAVFDVIGEKDVMVSKRAEYIALKDIMLYMGRMVTVSFFALWISLSTYLLHLRWYLLFIAFVQVLVCFCHHKMKICP